MSATILAHIHGPEDLRKTPAANLPRLARELRDFIIDIVAVKAGHLGASLGVVELTIALHYVFDTPNDKLIWDVGHQAYGHKILTGRRALFHTNRRLGGLSGFPKRDESPFDAFGTGHSSTSISAILGMALASQANGLTNRQHIAVIGDASIASGMAFEGLNHLGVTKANVLVVLNDNAIGIDPSVGALKKYLTNVKKGSAKDENIFECLNLAYSGPVDGHNLPALLAELERLRGQKGPRLLHVITTKGKGLRQAEEQQVTYHAPGRFNKRTGALEQTPKEGLPPKFQDVFGHTLVSLAENNPKIVGITPAMPTGSSLKYMMERFPDRAFDVGIAEQHAVTFAAGLAAEGMLPFCAIYATFLQRAYDQLIHDVALQSLPVVFCVDRAGIVGEDGPTHHGLFDMAQLRCVPNMILCAPMDERELRNMMYTAQLGLSQPMAIRYPRGRGLLQHWETPFEQIPLGRARTLRLGSQIALLTIGAVGNHAATAIDQLPCPEKVGHYDMRFVKPLDQELLRQLFRTYSQIVTVEDGCATGGFGSAVLEFAQREGSTARIYTLGVPDAFVPHGKVAELQALAGIDAAGILEQLRTLLDE